MRMWLLQTGTWKANIKEDEEIITRIADKYASLKFFDVHTVMRDTVYERMVCAGVIKLSDKIRKAGNELVSLMKKNYDQLMRTKKYRKLLKLYGSTEDKKSVKT